MVDSCKGYAGRLRLSAGRLALTACLVVMATGGVASASASQDSGAGAKYIAQGKELLAKGDLKAAEIQFKNAVREAPDDFDGRFQLGQVYLREGAGGAAEGVFNSLWQQHLRPEEVLPQLAEAYLLQRKTRELLEHVQPADYSVATNALIEVQRARAYLLQGQTVEAEGEIDRALVQRPGMVDALLVRATILSQAPAKPGAAEEIIDGILKNDPQEVRALRMKGNLRQTAGDHEGALKFYGMALDRHPDDEISRLGRAWSLVALKRTDEAQADIAAVLQRNPSHPFALFVKGRILADQGKAEEALALLQPVAARLSDVIPAQALLCELNLRLNHPDLAIEYGQRLYSALPDSSGARRLLALAYARKNNPQKVVDLLEPFVAKHADDSQSQVLLGNAYAGLGRYEEAARAFEQAAKTNPDDPDLRLRIDANRLRTADRDAAIKDLDQLVGSGRKVGEADLLLISVQMQSGRLAEAAETAEKLRGQQPNSPMADHMLGLIHQAMGDQAAARQNFQDALTKRQDFLPAADALAQLDLGEGQVREAEAVYDGILKADAKNRRAMQSLAILVANNGRPEEAIGWAEKAADADPQAVEPRLVEIELLLQQKAPQKALALANSVNSSFRDNAAVLQVLAHAQFASGDAGAAAASLLRAADMQPDSAGLRYRLGRALASIGRQDDARNAYQAAIKLDPLYFPALRDSALADLADKGIGPALDTADRASKQNANIGELLKAEIYVRAGKFAEADAAFGRALALQANSDVAVHRALARAASGDRSGAEALLAEWIKAHPEDAEPRFAFAGQLMSNGKYPQAVSEYERLLEKSPNNVVALNNLAWLYNEAKNAKALTIAKKAHGLAPLNPQISDTLGWILMGSGQSGEARKLFAVAHSLQPGDGEIAYHLAMAMEKDGEIAKAVEVLKPVVDGQPFSHQADAKAMYQRLVVHD